MIKPFLDCNITSVNHQSFNNLPNIDQKQKKTKHAVKQSSLWTLYSKQATARGLLPRKLKVMILS